MERSFVFEFSDLPGEFGTMRWRHILILQGLVVYFPLAFSAVSSLVSESLDRDKDGLDHIQSFLNDFFVWVMFFG